MKSSDFEKYIGELSPELREKARQCADMDELNRLLAENEVELSAEALEAVTGGCSLSDSKLDKGDLSKYYCPLCRSQLRYWDRIADGCEYYNRYYCDNPECGSYNNGLWHPVGGSLVFR